MAKTPRITLKVLLERPGTNFWRNPRRRKLRKKKILLESKRTPEWHEEGILKRIRKKSMEESKQSISPSTWHPKVPVGFGLLVGDFLVNFLASIIIRLLGIQGLQLWWVYIPPDSSPKIQQKNAFEISIALHPVISLQIFPAIQPRTLHGMPGVSPGIAPRIYQWISLTLQGIWSVIRPMIPLKVRPGNP